MTMEVDGRKVYGFVGSILKINLTDKTTEIIPTARYAPEFIGGRMLATRIYRDLVDGAPDPFSPENTLVFATGAGVGAGLPYSGRAVMVGVGAMGVPFSFMHSGTGGIFNAMLKYAGYDGFILEGAADERTHVVITDSKVEFRNADHLWGKYVADTQDALQEELGVDYQSLVIGPAGENKVRYASITNSGDSVMARAGFGAVFGAKNLKALSVYGTGTVEVSDKDALLALRKNPSCRPFRRNPEERFGLLPTTPTADFIYIDGDDAKMGFQTNCLGCVDPCCFSNFDVKGDTLSGHEDEPYDMVNKCIDTLAYSYVNECSVFAGEFLSDPEQEIPGQWMWSAPSISKPDTPSGKFLAQGYVGDVYNLWDLDVNVGRNMTWLCNQYGMDKWEVNIGIFCWLASLYKEGLLDGIDTGFEGSPCTPENVAKIMGDIAYRRGFGDILAEGTALGSRKLGKAKFGDSIYHGRFNAITGERLDIPVSNEACWGFAAHWSGRGFQGCYKADWLTFNLGWMIYGRETAAGQHPKNTLGEYKQYWKDPYHSDLFVDTVIRNMDRYEIKDMTLTCDFRSPNPTWPTLEADLYHVATGLDVTQEDLHYQAQRSRLLFRAIYMKDYGRDRDMEVEAMFPFMTWPDPWGEIAEWNDWNDLVDALYTKLGWDLATGWPFRSTWEKYGLGEIADEMEALGMLPPEGGTPGYVRKPCPFPERCCPVGETPEEAWKNVSTDIIQSYTSMDDPRMIAIVDPGCWE